MSKKPLANRSHFKIQVDFPDGLRWKKWTEPSNPKQLTPAHIANELQEAVDFIRQCVAADEERARLAAQEPRA